MKHKPISLEESLNILKVWCFWESWPSYWLLQNDLCVHCNRRHSTVFMSITGAISTPFVAWMLVHGKRISKDRNLWGSTARKMENANRKCKCCCVKEFQEGPHLVWTECECVLFKESCQRQNTATHHDARLQNRVNAHGCQAALTNRLHEIIHNLALQ